MKTTRTLFYKSALDFQKDLKELDNIVACQFNYEQNNGYIVIDMQKEEEKSGERIT